MMLRRRIATHAAGATARAGFTLMELLVVIAILVVLVSVATPMYFSYLEKSRVRAAKANASLLATALKNYQIEHGTLPPEGSWAGVPLDREPLDPWSKPFLWMSSMTTLADGTEIPVPVVFSSGPPGANYGPDGPCSSSSMGGG